MPLSYNASFWLFSEANATFANLYFLLTGWKHHFLMDPNVSRRAISYFSGISVGILLIEIDLFATLVLSV